MKKLLTGNEAIARGAWESGVRFASAYPGTPGTEILETLTACREIDLEAAIGASLAGAGSLASMKHVGVNVAADAFAGINLRDPRRGKEPAE
ncbi:MAG: hypothetical protein LBQ14_11010 [Treponema sp.]|nr:hypothetical protein [Treponema sp.]